jgi:hypothetical protein
MVVAQGIDPHTLARGIDWSKKEKEGDPSKYMVGQGRG